MARDYRKFKVYVLAYSFLKAVYALVLPSLPESELRNIYSQLQRASTSILLNIVEGGSSMSNKVFLNHLQYSYGSAKEVSVLLELCYDFSYINKEVFSQLSEQLEECKACLFRFMQSVDREVSLGLHNYTFL